MQERAKNWIRFLRRYGPIARNDNMYDERIQRSACRAGIRPLRFEHPYQSQVLSCFEPQNDASSVILTGTAGDGKTHLCRQVWQHLSGEEGAALDDPYVRTEMVCADGQLKRLHIIKDLNDLTPQQGGEWDQSSQELLQLFCRSLFEANPEDIFLIAANDGQLVTTWRRLEQTEPVRRVRHLFETLLVEDREQLPEARLKFYNLSRGSSAKLLDQALEAFLAHEEWVECYRANDNDNGFFSTSCPIRRNFELLQSPLVRSRLRSLFELCDYSRLHIPIRGLLLLLTNAVLGHPDVKDYLMTADDVPNIIRQGTAAKASVYNNLFGGNLPESRCEDIPVFDYLNRFRIGYETTNRIDNILIFGGTDEIMQPYFDSLIAQDPFYGADSSFYEAQHKYVEGGDESEGGTRAFLSTLVSQRRRLFFQIPSEQERELRLWELTVFKFAGEYLSRVVGALKVGRTVDQPILARLVKGLNRIFVGMLISNDRELSLATSLSYSYAKVSRLLVENISVRPRKGEHVEIVWRDDRPVLNVVLDEGIDVPLELNLIRFEFLSRVAEGALPNSFSRECHEDVLAYKSLLLSRLAERENRYKGGEKVSPLVFRLLNLDDSGNPMEEVIELTHAG
jgi:hypothetical protein